MVLKELLYYVNSFGAEVGNALPSSIPCVCMCVGFYAILQQKQSERDITIHKSCCQVFAVRVYYIHAQLGRCVYLLEHPP